MKQVYFAIYEENGPEKYVLSCSNKLKNVINLVKGFAAGGIRPIISGAFTEEQRETFYNFVDEANRTGVFDKKKLEELLIRY